MRLILRSRPFFWTMLVLIMLTGGIIRWYDIDKLPSGLYPDEAMNGTNALEANRTGDYKIFYPDNQGREGLFINIQALSVKAFGANIPALKLPSVIFGMLAILGIGLLAWELFRSRYAALIAAFLTATSYWAINFSRIGFRAIMVPFILSFAFYFFFRGLRKEKFIPFALSGLFFGAGLNTYTAYRLAPFILILLIPFLFLSYESFLKRFWKHALMFIVAAAITAAPMFYEFVSHPEIFSSRSAAVSVFSPEINRGNLWGTLTKTVGLSLIKYNFVGDQNWRHNYPPYPILDPIAGIFFLAGLIFSVKMFLQLLWNRFRTKDHDVELSVHAFLLLAFFIMLAPEFLTNEGLPHALRSIGTQPAVFLLATIPILFLFRKLAQAKGGTKVAIMLSLSLVLATSAMWNITKYFVFFRNRPEQHASFNENFTNMATYLVSLPKETHKYVIPENGIAVQPIVFLTNGLTENLEVVSGSTTFRSPAILIPQHYDPQIIGNIRTYSPAAYETDIDLDPGFGTGFKAIMIP
ncbi:MAG: glycosyltransferase family 39 protein [Candidatus Moranbacteria bacterium]|nr:glycosyltransferase family 39 protein [Candidatus Moranbacteria bacterium]